LKAITLPSGGGPDGKSPILIRKGGDIIYSLYSMHRRKDLYGADADAFRPERWENKQLDSVENSFGYIPFHGGPRICPGRMSIVQLVAIKSNKYVQKILP
jgi:cytochrome P450